MKRYGMLLAAGLFVAGGATPRSTTRLPRS